MLHVSKNSILYVYIRFIITFPFVKNDTLFIYLFFLFVVTDHLVTEHRVCLPQLSQYNLLGSDRLKPLLKLDSALHQRAPPPLLIRIL